jgi:outer membrane immunogenic protein
MIPRRLLALTFLLAVTASPASAQTPPVFTWSGCYVGAQAGYQWGHDRTTEFVNGVATTLDEKTPLSSAVAGGFLGCNVATAGSLVWGAEVDAVKGWAKGGYRYTSGDGTDTAQEWEGTVRGRLGFAFGNTMPYVAGGLAVGQFRHTYVANYTQFEPNLNTHLGWTIGAGVEHMFASNWIARLEYRFTDFGAATNFSPMFGASYREEPQFHSVRLGASYRFWTP